MRHGKSRIEEGNLVWLSILIEGDRWDYQTYSCVGRWYQHLLGAPNGIIDSNVVTSSLDVRVTQYFIMLENMDQCFGLKSHN